MRQLDNDVSAIYGLLTDLSEQVAGHTRRFDLVDRSLHGIDGRLGSVDGRLEGVDDRLGSVDDRLEGIDGALREILRRLPEAS